MFKLIVLLVVLAPVAANDAQFVCPATSCWCRDTFPQSSVKVTSDVYYRTAYNKVTKKNQSSA
jgi:hypothetical protein